MMGRLRLYVAGSGPASMRAIANATLLCEARLAGRFELEVIDLRRHPDQALPSVAVAPTLLKDEPAPQRQAVGHLADADKVLAALGITPEARR